LQKIGETLIWPKNRLTRFEFARLIGARALQISLGAPVLVKTDEQEARRVAELEFNDKMLPISIKRKMPSGEDVIVNVKAAIENWLAERKAII